MQNSNHIYNSVSIVPGRILLVNADIKLSRYAVYFGILLRNEVDVVNLSMSKIEFEMRQRIIRKLENVGANSKGTATFVVDASLDLQEQYWLPYLIGYHFSKIRKTSDNRYYIKN